MARFSEGEWFLAEDGRTVYAGRAPEDAPGAFPWPGVHFVCEVGDTVEGLEGDDPVADANARLIAAAPDLLAFADAYVAAFLDIEMGQDTRNKLFNLACEAITKATGERP